ncbi:MAG: hypothetical protein HY986_10570 [Candidatus Melainabacteria bacterium]|nr:hypothetical protein [Candidatus Melainabacteria bacterium]
MINFEFKDDRGRTIRPDQLGDYVRKSLESQLKSVLHEEAQKLARQHQLTSVRCPQHGSTALNWRLEPRSPGSDQHHLVYDECCQALVQAIDAAAPK